MPAQSKGWENGLYIFLIDFHRQKGKSKGEREREKTSVCCFTYMHPLVECALIGGHNHGLGVSGWHCNQLSYSASTRLYFNGEEQQSCLVNEIKFFTIFQIICHFFSNHYFNYSYKKQISTHQTNKNIYLSPCSITFPVLDKILINFHFSVIYSTVLSLTICKTWWYYCYLTLKGCKTVVCVLF